MILVSPAFALVAVFVLFPLGFAVYISLTNWPLIGPYHFTGGRNYTELIHDPVFIHSVVFTLLYTAIVTGPILVLGYTMATFVRANRPGSVVFRTAFFLPFIVGLATESFMLLLELQPDSGVVDAVLGQARPGQRVHRVDRPLRSRVGRDLRVRDLVRVRADDDDPDGRDAGHSR